jgi:tRNA(Ile)-lysidine synthase
MAASRNRPSPERPANADRPVAALAGIAGQLAGRRVAVGLSGGRDSVCLLHALHGLRDRRSFDLVAVHVHHGLSPHADAWPTLCADFCRSLGVPLDVRRVTVDRASGQGIEAAARAARYGVFAGLAVDAVLLAHHRDDQAETLLLNLLRGAGVHGAAGMPPQRRLHNHQEALHCSLLRPFLHVPRADIEAYVALHRLPFIDDDSNTDTRFRRNFLRQDVFPLLRERFPNADEQLAAAAERFAAAASLLDELATIDLTALARPGGLDCRGLAALSKARQRNLLRRWLSMSGERAASAELIDEALRQALSLRSDVEARIPLARHDLHVWRGLLRLDEKAAGAPVGSLRWCGESELPWAGGVVRFVQRQGEGICLARLPPLELRLRHGGETLRLLPQGPRRAVKKLLQEHDVPPWQRTRLPFVWGNDELLCVPGLGVAAIIAAQPDEMGLCIEWHAEGGEAPVEPST